MLRMLRSRARCMRVAKVLQSYLDGEVTSEVADAVAEHLEECRRCGLEADTYRAIKESVASVADGRAAAVDAGVVERLNRFAQELSQNSGGSQGTGDSPPSDD